MLNHSLDPLQGFGETVIHLDQGTLNNLRAGSTSIKEWDDFPTMSNPPHWNMSLMRRAIHRLGRYPYDNKT